MASRVAPSAKSALYTSFALVTQLQLPHVVGGWNHVAEVAIEITSLVLLFGGVALLVGEVQKKVQSTGVWRGE